MITLIILITLVAIGVIIAQRSYNYDTVGIFLAGLSGSCLIIHILLISVKSYDYEMFVVKRNAFSETLKSARESGREYETAAIVSEISSINIKLASLKYDNKTIFLDQYIDDRFDLLEPIK